MSQSPDAGTESTSPDELVRYRNAWSALSQLIGKGRSFSGYERNCAFLNIGRGRASGTRSGDDENSAGERRFAVVSSVSGLDYADDGRAVALFDHDFDGDLDLLLANRTAPRIRLVRNDTPPAHHWVAFRLRGVKVNRDAIGARVEVILPGPSNRRRLKTLHAGEGYLSQSSKWISFGLGDAPEIERVLVRWPGGAEERFEGVTVDRHWTLVEGEGRAEAWAPPGGRVSLLSGPLRLPPPSSSTRTVLVDRVPIPEASYIPWEDDAKSAGGTSTAMRSLDTFRERPVLVSLWSATCAPCLAELSEWSRNEARIRAAGLEILAVSVDELAGDPAAKSAADARSKETLARIAFPFARGRATTALADSLETLHRAYVELQIPLPVPASVLLDRRGRGAVIYKGRVALDELLGDVALLDGPDAKRRESAVPFSGRWASLTFPASPEPILRSLDMANRPEAALDYARRYAAFLESGALGEELASPATAAAVRLLGERLYKAREIAAAEKLWARLRALAPRDAALHGRIGRDLLLAGRLESASEHFTLAVMAGERHPELLYNFGLAELGLRRFPRAAALFRRSLEAREDDPTTHYQLGNTLVAMKETREAVRHFRRALELRPGWPYPANNLAWILATAEDDDLRDGAAAVRLAEEVCLATGHRDAGTLATLAAAYAEAGRFDEATRTNERARSLAAAGGLDELAASLSKRQELYRARRPYRAEP